MLTRRNILEKCAALGSILIASRSSPEGMLAAFQDQEKQIRKPTPPNTLGPFYKRLAPINAKLTGAVTPDAKISWTADDDSERAGFEILWRETTEPRWRLYDFAVSPGETVLRGVSTDNHFFAVRAVGKNGARSMAVPTEMERRPPPLPAGTKQ